MEIISYTTPKARKDHTCDWCNEKIKVGEIYTRSFCKEDDIYVWKNHIYCEEIAEKLKMFNESIEVTKCLFFETISEEFEKIKQSDEIPSFK
jgi:hypothetical protein